MTNINPSLAVVILAAGKGKRMNNPEMAKVMSLLSDKPLIRYVIDSVTEINPLRIIIVVGHQKQSVIDYCRSINSNIDFAVQEEQLGTGHAVAMSENLLNDFNGSVLILAGDVPLLKTSTLERFIEFHTSEKSAVTVLSTLAPDASGYGRIIRAEDKSFLKIVEHKDAEPNELLINEINSGIFIVDSKTLFDSLHSVSNTNAQKEYYLTDIIEIIRKIGLKVSAFPGADFNELQGVNSPDDLIRAEESLKKLN